MSLDESLIAKEIEGWRPFGDALRAEDRELYRKMMDQCCEYLPAMEVKASTFPNEALFMGIIFLQHKIIQQLVTKVQKLEQERR